MKMSVISAALIAAMSATSAMAVTVDLTSAHHLTSPLDGGSGLTYIVNSANAIIIPGGQSTDYGNPIADNSNFRDLLTTFDASAGPDISSSNRDGVGSTITESGGQLSLNRPTEATNATFTTAGILDYEAIALQIEVKFLGGDFGGMPNTVAEAWAGTVNDDSPAGRPILKAMDVLNAQLITLNGKFDQYAAGTNNVTFANVDDYATVVGITLDKVNQTILRLNEVTDEVRRQGTVATDAALAAQADAVQAHIDSF